VVAVDPDTQVFAIADLLLTIGYIDGQLHPGEADFIRGYVERVIEHVGRGTGGADRIRARVDTTYARLEAEIGAMGAEVVAAGDSDFTKTRLKVRALSLFRTFSPTDQKIALELLDAVIRTDGVITQQEQDLYAELVKYFHAAPSVPAPSVLPALHSTQPTLPTLHAPQRLPLEATSHPLLEAVEHGYSNDPTTLRAQLHADYDLVFQAINVWERQRARGNGRLVGVTDIEQLPLATRVLDERVYVMRPNRLTELVVLGDLHGCYACLKAALLQSRFIERAVLAQQDPMNHPDVKLVLLGDYIDRGRFGFEGVLRAALQLLARLPEHVIMLRGNHEFFVRHGQNIVSAVNPAEALPALAQRAPIDLLEAYRHLFEHMPTSLVFDRMLFVHGSIPRDDTSADRIRDLSGLNDPVVRFEMMWGDPVATDHVPVELQRQTPRFSFGAQQLSQFLARVGCHTLIRGHEQVDTGFMTNFDLGHCRMHTVFSAGGRDNSDLPAESRYRGVVPMALTVRHSGTSIELIPWEIDYARLCGPEHNGLYR
jgi:hypothetical protein